MEVTTGTPEEAMLTKVWQHYAYIKAYSHYFREYKQYAFSINKSSVLITK